MNQDKDLRESAFLEGFDGNDAYPIVDGLYRKTVYRNHRIKEAYLDGQKARNGRSVMMATGKWCRAGEYRRDSRRADRLLGQQCPCTECEFIGICGNLQFACEMFNAWVNHRPARHRLRVPSKHLWQKIHADPDRVKGKIRSI